MPLYTLINPTETRCLFYNTIDKKNPEQYISLIYNTYSSANYSTPSNQAHFNNYIAQDFETVLVNDPAKLYAKDLLDEILSKYDITISRSSYH